MLFTEKQNHLFPHTGHTMRKPVSSTTTNCYCSPEFGRWTKRDPIEEAGGDDIYTLIGNNVIKVNDKLGMVGESDASWEDESCLQRAKRCRFSKFSSECS